jgi:hypothetical protein
MLKNTSNNPNRMFDKMFTKGEPIRQHLLHRPVNTLRQLEHIDRFLGYASASACEKCVRHSLDIYHGDNTIFRVLCHLLMLYCNMEPDS